MHLWLIYSPGLHFERKHKYCTNKLTNKHHRWFRSLHTRGESVSVWREHASTIAICFLFFCVVSVVLFRSVLSLSRLCLYSCCCHLSYSCLHVTWFSKQAPTHLLFCLTNALAFSNNGSLDATTAGTPLRTKELCKNSCFFSCGVSCKGGRTRGVSDSIGSPMTWTIARSEWHRPPEGQADVTFSVPYKGGLHPGNQIKTHIRRQLMWASFLSAPCAGRENLELGGKIGSVNMEIT